MICNDVINKYAVEKEKIKMVDVGGGEKMQMVEEG
jgi:hypothetical protein